MRLSGNQSCVLHKLLDQYERSATFQGKNKVHQSFSIQMKKMFPRYFDDAEYDFFHQMNEDMIELEKMHLILISKNNDRIEKIFLDYDNLSGAYELLDRVPRNIKQGQILDFLDRQESILEGIADEGILAEQVSELKNVYGRYIEAQRIRIDENKSVEYLDDMEEYEELWQVLFALLTVEDEIYVRDLSVRLFRDSKKLEKLRSKAEGLLYKYGEYPDKNMILEEYGVIKTPSYVMVKGNVIFKFLEQTLNLGTLRGDVAFSTESLKDVISIQVKGSRVITIENLTSFHRYVCGTEEAAIYLGGYHNRAKRMFLKCLYRDNPDVEYRHFGDIDAGGFYIFEHLKRKTGIPFRTLHMDADTLLKYKKYAKALTPNDERRIQSLIELVGKNQHEPELMEALNTMLKTGFKLEQEAVECCEEGLALNRLVR